MWGLVRGGGKEWLVIACFDDEGFLHQYLVLAAIHGDGPIKLVTSSCTHGQASRVDI